MDDLIKKIIINVVSGIASAVATSREVMAATLEDIARQVRSGALIPQETFDKAKSNQQELDSIINQLPQEQER